SPEKIVDPHEKTEAISPQIVVGANVHRIAGTKGRRGPKGITSDSGQHCASGMRVPVLIQEHGRSSCSLVSAVIAMEVIDHVPGSGVWITNRPAQLKLSNVVRSGTIGQISCRYSDAGTRCAWRRRRTAKNGLDMCIGTDGRIRIQVYKADPTLHRRQYGLLPRRTKIEAPMGCDDQWYSGEIGRRHIRDVDHPIGNL